MSAATELYVPGGASNLKRAAGVTLGLVLLFWTLMPIYNMVVVALENGDDVMNGNLWPEPATLAGFKTVLTQDHWYLRYFWRQMFNSLVVGIATALLTVGIAGLASFAIGRLRVRFGRLLSTAALLTYVIPTSFLAIPFYDIMHRYGLADHLLAVVLVEVTFATPYAIFIFQQYATSIPKELDESARVDGASVPQIFAYIYMPLMLPALVAVGTYALLLAWNEYLYAFLLLSSENNVTIPVALGFFLSSDEAPWNLLMGAAIIYSIPPLVIYYAFRGQMSGGLTIGGVKG